jgi:hypothetical protein
VIVVAILPNSVRQHVFPLLYAFDAGNGVCKAVSAQTEQPVRFEPVIAPMTDRRALIAKDEQPRFSLVAGGKAEVFGIDDVFAHGKRTAMRRLNSRERYTARDYFHLLDVLYLHAFPQAWNKATPIAPTGVINIPINQYNDEHVVKALRERLMGERTLEDANGNTLHLKIEPQRLLVVPESYGALMHYVYDPTTLRRRPEADTSGATLVIDVGYETTDMSLFEGLRYQRDRAETETRAGMGVIARAMQQHISRVVRDVDVNRVDRALQVIAGAPADSPKTVEPIPSVIIDITEAYDEAVGELAIRIAQEVLTRFPEAVGRVLLAGGGAYHLERPMREHLTPLKLEVAPDADMANVLGNYTMLNLHALTGQYLDQGQLI